MVLKELKNNFKKSLSELYPPEEIHSFFAILSKKYLALSPMEVALNPKWEVSDAVSGQFETALFRLKTMEPIQYIVGETEFYGLPFKVTEQTLIPRPETEELVAYILGHLSIKNQDLEILDIGTGSGCIAVTLAKNILNVTISALDISEGALKIARQNAELNNAEVFFFRTDILNEKKLPKQYDIIISNPPYVRELEKRNMRKNVLKYEPESALYVPDSDPLLFYRAISKLAKKYLKPNGKLFFEINEYLGKEMKLLLLAEDFKNIEVKKDIYGKDRMIKCSLDEKT